MEKFGTSSMSGCADVLDFTGAGGRALAFELFLVGGFGFGAGGKAFEVSKSLLS